MNELQPSPIPAELHKDEADKEEQPRNPFAESEANLSTRFPGKFIKFRSFERADMDSLDSATQARIISHSQQLWNELGNEDGKYKVPMINTDFVIGTEPPEQMDRGLSAKQQWEGKPGYYSIGERVIGTTLVEEIANPNSLVTNEEIDRVFGSIGNYYIDKLHSGEEFVVDMNIEQFMCGYLETNPEKKGVFLIDQEPLYGNAIDNGTLTGGFASLRFQAHKVAEMVLKVEEERSITLESAHAAAVNLLKALPPHPAPFVRSDGTAFNPTLELIGKMKSTEPRSLN
jgi:hypothetical protein